MADLAVTPRITAQYLDSFVNRNVLLVGKVTELRGDQATIDCEGTVTLILNRVSLRRHPPTRRTAQAQPANRACLARMPISSTAMPRRSLER